jgi:hypothetical protein
MLFMSDDPVPAEVRQLEEIADEFYRGNGLMQLPFSEAAWYVLAHAEELTLARHMAVIRGEIDPDEHDWAGFYDYINSTSKWPLYWVYNNCLGGKKLPKSIDGDAYSAANDLWDLGEAYISFETVFTYASLGMLKLVADGQRIRVSDDLRGDTRYQAYDLMSAVAEGGEKPQRGQEFVGIVQDTVRVRKNTFAYQLDPRIVAQGFEYLGDAIASRFKIPPEIALSRYTAGDFHAVAKTLWIIANIHYTARTAAAQMGCPEMGWANALCTFRTEELKLRLARYTGLAESIVDAIVTTMTYGERGINYPDIALQPIVALTKDCLAFSPTMMINSALERNHMTLLNRIEVEKEYYAAISDARENLSRESLLEEISDLGLREWHGEIGGWQEDREIDLVLVDDVEKQVLLLELKSFIDPAETREINHRAEEIEKGVDQVRRRRERYSNNPELLNAVTGTDQTYSVSFGVISENSIGPSYVQDEDVFVVSTSHIARELNRSGSVSQVSAWLAEKKYLPIEGTHFENVKFSVEIGSVSLDWYGVSVKAGLPSI